MSLSKIFLFLASGHFALKDPEISEGLAVFVNKMKSKGIIELFDPNKILPPISKESALDRIQQDLSLFGVPATEKDSNRKREPPYIEEKGARFCPVALEGVYSSLLESRLLGHMRNGPP